MNPGAVGGHPQGSPSLKTPTVHIRVGVCLLPGPRPHPRCEGFRSVSPAEGWESFGALWAVATRGQHDSPTVRSQSSLGRLSESPGGGGGGRPHYSSQTPSSWAADGCAGGSLGWLAPQEAASAESVA